MERHSLPLNILLENGPKSFSFNKLRKQKTLLEPSFVCFIDPDPHNKIMQTARRTNLLFGVNWL